MISCGVSVPDTFQTLVLTLAESASVGMTYSSSVTELSLVSLETSGSSWTKGRIELARLKTPSFWLEVALIVMVDEICRKKFVLAWCIINFIMHHAANANGTSLVNDKYELYIRVINEVARGRGSGLLPRHC